MIWDAHAGSLDFATLHAAYRSGSVTPQDVVRAVYARIAARADDKVWIELIRETDAIAMAVELAGQDIDHLPLYGLPFAIKDNIDVSGIATTAACPAYRYVPQQSATVVARLVAAGAIPIGKTNLDQFATGLLGVLSPYGAASSVFHPDYVSGGSSSGSAVAVAAGLVSFALGTDTAGSGRVPAAFNNIVGLKPTRGLLSTAGVVPACRSLDCVSIFSLTCDDAWSALNVMQGDDDGDPFLRDPYQTVAADLAVPPSIFRFGVPPAADLRFFGDRDYERSYDASLSLLEKLGGTRVVIDWAPFAEAAALLYEGPWVAERYAAIHSFIDNHAEAMHPTTRQVIAAARARTAVEAFEGSYRLAELRSLVATAWRGIDLLALPTAPTIFRLEQAIADPIQCSRVLGTYTNFVNLLDLAAIAVPAAIDARGLPFGITLIGPALADARLCAISDAVHRSAGVPLGAGQQRISPVPRRDQRACGHAIAVVGAHLSGMPLNHQLLDLGATLVRATSTAKRYRLYALSHTTPPKPGLKRVGEEGAAVAVEVWDIPAARVSPFLAAIASPLALGQIELEDGSWVTGFVCEPWALEDALDITNYGGWRAYRAARAGVS